LIFNDVDFIICVNLNRYANQKIEPACDEILGQSYEAYFATGPVIALPFV
jgi:hypothetical protein